MPKAIVSFYEDAIDKRKDQVVCLKEIFAFVNIDNETNIVHCPDLELTFYGSASILDKLELDIAKEETMTDKEIHYCNVK